MKYGKILLAVLIIGALLPTFALADVAGVGVIIAVSLLPYVLIAAVLVIAVAVLIKALRSKKQ